MSTPEFLVEFHSTQQTFRYLRALLDYASHNKHSESSIYGAISFVLTHFCMGASVTAPKFENLYLGSFPQRDLKMLEQGREFRAPDFTVLVIQSSIGRQSISGMIKDVGPLIWEVKISSTSLIWFGEGRSLHTDFGDLFVQHFHQVAAQVAFAKAKFHQNPVYAILSVDVWFTLLYFPQTPPSVTWTNGKKSRPIVHPVDCCKFYDYVIVPPSPMINEDCTAFSPEFLYALQRSIENVPNVTVASHPSFRPPEGTAELVAALLEEEWFSAKCEEEARGAEVDGKFARGEEESDERSSHLSTAEDTETDIEKQKHPAAAPTTADHHLTSPAKTRSKSAALKAHMAPQATAQAKRSNIAENTATTSKEVPVVHPVPAREARLRRPRRKAAEKIPGYRKDSFESD